MSSDPTTSASDFARELESFTGTEHHYRHPFGLTFTDGVRHLILDIARVRADDGGRCNGAFWLLDAIAAHQPKAKLRCGSFQLWTLAVSVVEDRRRATLTCCADSDKPPVITQEIEYTDFPLPSVSLYVIDGVALLPSEY